MAVVGGGLAGIAAAEYAARNGFRVTLFERARVLGGRVASLYEPISGQWIDNGQHLLLGCCTELLALNERLNLSSFFDRKDSIPFAQTDGKRWLMAASPYLPNRWQLAPAFLKIPFLSFKDRLATGLMLRKLGKRNQTGAFAQWLAAEHASDVAVEKFWSPLIFSALSETVENVSFEAVQKVVCDGFLSGREAMSVYLPKIPLRDIYHAAALGALQKLGVEVRFFARIRRLHWDYFPDDSADAPASDPPNVFQEKTDNNSDDDDSSGVPRITALEMGDGSLEKFDSYVLAAPAYRTREILEASELEPYVEQLGIDRFEPGAITTIHLWTNRRLMGEFSHIALLGGPGQFLFCPRTDSAELTGLKKSGNESVGDSADNEKGFYHAVVISAAHRLLSESELSSRNDSPLLERVMQQLQGTFPESFPRNGQEPTRLLHHRITTFFDAVFSPNPSVYLERPPQETPFSNFALAGDWTQTHWPSTMEGAVRSGLLAVDVIKNEER